MSLTSVRLLQGESYNKEDGYSAFASSHPEHADKSHITKLLIDNHITHLFICGLATDACVKASANHALEDRLEADIAWDVFLIKEVSATEAGRSLRSWTIGLGWALTRRVGWLQACWGIDDEDSKQTLDLMDEKGAKKISIEGDELKEVWREAAAKE